MIAPLCRRCGKNPQARDTGWCVGCLDAEDDRRTDNGHRTVTIAAPGTETLPESVDRRERRHRSPWWIAAHRPRLCRECEGVFTPRDLRQVFCSPACRKRYASRDARRRSERESDPTPWGGHVASRDPRSGAESPVTNRGLPTCAHPDCGKPFKPRRSDQRFCCNACRQAAYRQRKADR